MIWSISFGREGASRSVTFSERRRYHKFTSNQYSQLGHRPPISAPFTFRRSRPGPTGFRYRRSILNSKSKELRFETRVWVPILLADLEFKKRLWCLYNPQTDLH